MSEFRTMRRKRQELTETECIEILEKATSGVLSLLGDNGYPYGVPITPILVGRKLYFHSAIKGHKVDAILNSDKASFTVIDRNDVKPKEFTTYFRSVICFGKVRLIEDETEKMEAFCKLVRRYNPDDEEGLRYGIKKDFSHLVMIEFTIEHISGKEAIELVRMKKSPR